MEGEGGSKQHHGLDSVPDFITTELRKSELQKVQSRKGCVGLKGVWLTEDFHILARFFSSCLTLYKKSM